MVSTRLKNIIQIGSFPQVGLKMKNISNHHLVEISASKTPYISKIGHPIGEDPKVSLEALISAEAKAEPQEMWGGCLNTDPHKVFGCLGNRPHILEWVPK